MVLPALPEPLPPTAAGSISPSSPAPMRASRPAPVAVERSSRSAMLTSIVLPDIRLVALRSKATLQVSRRPSPSVMKRPLPVTIGTPMIIGVGVKPSSAGVRQIRVCATWSQVGTMSQVAPAGGIASTSRRRPSAPRNRTRMMTWPSTGGRSLMAFPPASAAAPGSGSTPAARQRGSRSAARKTPAVSATAGARRCPAPDRPA